MEKVAGSAITVNQCANVRGTSSNDGLTVAATSVNLSQPTSSGCNRGFGGRGAPHPPKRPPSRSRRGPEQRAPQFGLRRGCRGLLEVRQARLGRLSVSGPCLRLGANAEVGSVATATRGAWLSRLTRGAAVRMNRQERGRRAAERRQEAVGRRGVRGAADGWRCRELMTLLQRRLSLFAGNTTERLPTSPRSAAATGACCGAQERRKTDLSHIPAGSRIVGRERGGFNQP